MTNTPWNGNSKAGGGGLKQKCPPWERGMDLFLELHIVINNHSSNTPCFLFACFFFFLQKLDRKDLPLIHQKSSLLSLKNGIFPNV